MRPGQAVDSPQSVEGAWPPREVFPGPLNFALEPPLQAKPQPKLPPFPVSWAT